MKSCLGVKDEPITLLPVCRSRELEILQVYGVKKKEKHMTEKVRLIKDSRFQLAANCLGED